MFFGAGSIKTAPDWQEKESPDYIQYDNLAIRNMILKGSPREYTNESLNEISSGVIRQLGDCMINVPTQKRLNTDENWQNQNSAISKRRKSNTDVLRTYAKKFLGTFNRNKPIQSNESTQNQSIGVINGVGLKSEPIKNVLSIHGCLQALTLQKSNDVEHRSAPDLEPENTPEPEKTPEAENTPEIDNLSDFSYVDPASPDQTPNNTPMQKQSNAVANHELTEPILKCLGCEDSLFGKDVCSLYCGHIYCKECIEFDISHRKICLSCNKRVVKKQWFDIYFTHEDKLKSTSGGKMARNSGWVINPSSVFEERPQTELKCTDCTTSLLRKGTKTFALRCGHLYCAACREHNTSNRKPCIKCNKRINKNQYNEIFLIDQNW